MLDVHWFAVLCYAYAAYVISCAIALNSKKKQC